MQKVTRKPTTMEWMALVVALILGFAVATTFGNLTAGIAIVITIAMIGSGFFYTRK